MNTSPLKSTLITPKCILTRSILVPRLVAQTPEAPLPLGVPAAGKRRALLPASLRAGVTGKLTAHSTPGRPAAADKRCPGVARQSTQAVIQTGSLRAANIADAAARVPPRDGAVAGSGVTAAAESHRGGDVPGAVAALSASWGW